MSIQRIGERPVGMSIPEPTPVLEPEPVEVRIKVKAPTPAPDPSPVAPTTDSTASFSGLLPSGAATAERLVVAPTIVVESPAPTTEQLPWSRPLGVFAENRMLRFLYLDKVIGWVFHIRFENWYAKTLPTAHRDAQPDDRDRHKVAAAAHHRRSDPAMPPAGAADARAVTEVSGPWRHEDLLHRDDKLRKDRARLL